MPQKTLSRYATAPPTKGSQEGLPAPGSRRVPDAEYAEKSKPFPPKNFCQNLDEPFFPMVK